MGIIVQVIATVLLCISCMNVGISIGWPSSTILLFKSENTTLHRPMRDMDIALFSSLATFGSLVAHPLVIGSLLDNLGRKQTAILTSLLFVVAWSIIAFTNRVEGVMAAVLIAGFGYPVFLISVIYISEIVQDSIRGALTASPNLFCGLGYLTSYFFGGALTYHMMVYVNLSLAVIGVIVIAVIKEPAVSLLATNREEAAAKSLAFYRQISSNSNEVLTELNSLRRTVNAESDDILSLTQVAHEIKPGSKTKKMSCWQFFKSCPSTRQQFYLVIVLKTAYVYQGLPVVQVYAKPIFTAAVNNAISPDLCSIVLGLVVLIAGVSAAYLTDTVGRRPLQIYSSIVSCICCGLLGTQVLTEWFPKWTIPVFICIYATSHTVGSGNVPFVVSAEIFRPEVKSILLVFTAEWLYACQFISLFLFNIIIQSIGLAPVFYFFSTVCLATAVYFFYFLPETKGLSVYAIQALFMKHAK